MVSRGAAPGASVAVVYRSGSGSGRGSSVSRTSSSACWAVSLGAAGTLAPWSLEPVNPDTPYDLASVTKPFTAVSLALALRTAGLPLDCPLGVLLPRARGTPVEHVPLELLLSHRAGLHAHLPLFEPLRTGHAVRSDSVLAGAVRGLRAPLPSPLPGEGVEPLYSDLGYLLAGAAGEGIAHAALDEVMQRTVIGPLELAIGSARQWLARDPTFMVRVAPTERVAWRGGVVRGVVHDENAWALAGHGVAGQAGLFGTAEGVARFGAAVLDALAERAAWADASVLEPLVRVRPGGSLRAGFDGKSPTSSAAGDLCGPRTFGHLGFTGTSLWCDPDAEVVVAVLTNRVCPTRDHLAIRAARPRIHDALFRLGKTLTATEARSA